MKNQKASLEVSRHRKGYRRATIQTCHDIRCNGSFIVAETDASRQNQSSISQSIVIYIDIQLSKRKRTGQMATGTKRTKRQKYFPSKKKIMPVKKAELQLQSMM